MRWHETGLPDYLSSLANRFAENEWDRDDLLHDMWIRVLEIHTKYQSKPEQERLAALAVAAKNRALDWVREQRRDQARVVNGLDLFRFRARHLDVTEEWWVRVIQTIQQRLPVQAAITFQEFVLGDQSAALARQRQESRGGKVVVMIQDVAEVLDRDPSTVSRHLAMAKLVATVVLADTPYGGG